MIRAARWVRGSSDPPPPKAGRSTRREAAPLGGRFHSRVVTAIWALASVLSIQGLQAQDAGEKPEESRSISEATGGFEHLPGFLDVYWDARGGRLFLKVDATDSDLLYIESLSAGLGSNDIGLDRGQLGRTHLARFERVGPKLLLVHQNTRFRAVSDNPDERRAVADAFARSVLWGFEVAAEDDDGALLVDATDFVLRDAHGVVARLRQRGQGSYELDGSRSAIHRPGVAAFPRNSELEGTVTFTLRSSDRGPGAWVRQVAPSPEALTVRVRHSFVALPEPGYEPRRADPRAGFNVTSYFDYATPIDQPLEAVFIDRHRLEKRDPNAERKRTGRTDRLLPRPGRAGADPLRVARRRPLVERGVRGRGLHRRVPGRAPAGGRRPARRPLQRDPVGSPVDPRMVLRWWGHRPAHR